MAITSFPVERELLNRLAKRSAKGLGFSAIQLGIPKQVFLMQKPKKEYVCNPKIILKLFKKKNAETCLSVGKDFWETKRPSLVLASYQTPMGKKKIKVFTGLGAHIFDHEYDHLHGVLVSDKGVRGHAVLTRWGRKFEANGGK